MKSTELGEQQVSGMRSPNCKVPISGKTKYLCNCYKNWAINTDSEILFTCFSMEMLNTCARTYTGGEGGSSDLERGRELNP